MVKTMKAGMKLSNISTQAVNVSVDARTVLEVPAKEVISVLKR